MGVKSAGDKSYVNVNKNRVEFTCPSPNLPTNINNWKLDPRNSEVQGGTSAYIDQLTISDCVTRCAEDASCYSAVVLFQEGDGKQMCKRTCHHRFGTGHPDDVKINYNANQDTDKNKHWVSYVRPGYT
jgi:hypothetical protein